MDMDIDVVIIGVNCAGTLPACIQSVIGSEYSKGTIAIWYVDGGSNDGSISIADSFDQVSVVSLTPEYPAPGLQRNAGWKEGTAPLVFFMDSDTVLNGDFFEKAVATLQSEASLGAVFGARREIAPDASIYNWIGDLEWNPPSGIVQSFGGDVLVKRQALEQTGGYDETLVGGEDPDLGVRFGKAGWNIVHLDIPMTMHDLAIHSLRQHCRRAFRTGYGFAAVSVRHIGARGFWLYELLRICIRGGGFVTLFVLGLLLGHLPGVALAFLALILLFYPRLFSVEKFMRNLNLPKEKAQVYAWHCALIVLPQLAGVMRFAGGLVTGRPLRNKAAKLSTTAMMMLIIAMLSACSARVQPQPTEEAATNATQTNATLQFTTEAKKLDDFTPIDIINKFSDEIPEEYTLGPGDVLSLQVWNRPNLSDPEIVVAPDGSISVMRIGFMNVNGKTLPELTEEVREKLAVFYSNPEVRITIKVYKNNKAFVLGRVTSPGLIEFSGKGTLLEALARAGGLPILREEAFLTKCAIIRGKDQVIWIDLRELLQEGNMALNARIQNNDIIFIPESEDELIYVMGEIQSPGAIRLKSKLTFLDALMFSGGPTPNADLERAYIIRFEGGQRTIKQINLKSMLETADGSQNYVLKDNDVVYVAETGMASFNYHLEQIMPSLEVLNLGTSVLERFGIMQDLRRKWYGTQGFVNGE